MLIGRQFSRKKTTRKLFCAFISVNSYIKPKLMVVYPMVGVIYFFPYNNPVRYRSLGREERGCVHTS